MNKKGFTLVELLAVITVISLILIISVPKVLETLNNSKKGTFELTAMSIALAAENKYVENKTLGISKKIKCEDIANLNKIDYKSCKIIFEGNTAKVTIIGKGKYSGINICDATKVSALAINDVCGPKVQDFEVNYPLFLLGQELTPDKFKITATYEDGTTKVLENGKKLGLPDDSEVETITSPNWPNNYPDNMKEEKYYWIKTFEGASAMQITFDSSSETQNSNPGGVTDVINIYNKEGIKLYELYGYGPGGSALRGQTYIIPGDYIKVTMKSNSSTNYKGFSADIMPIYMPEAEYTVSPSVAPSVEKDFDVTISINDHNISKKVTVTAGTYNASDYIVGQKGISTIQTNALYNETSLDAGIRYVGQNPSNKVYFNCLANNYGSENYNYDENCEIWRIIGVFNVKPSENESEVSMVKLVKDEFLANTMPWDTAEDNMSIVNQWGETTLSDGTLYAGSSLMQYLNGTTAGNYYYSLSSIAKEQISDAIWYTGAPEYLTSGDPSTNKKLTPANAFVDERNTEKKGNSTLINYTSSWKGKIGLIYPSDYGYAADNCTYVNESKCSRNNWLSVYSGEYWTISPTNNTNHSWYINKDGAYYYTGPGNSLTFNKSVRPAVYLKPNIKIIGGNGQDKPYILSTS